MVTHRLLGLVTVRHSCHDPSAAAKGLTGRCHFRLFWLCRPGWLHVTTECSQEGRHNV